MADRFWFFAAEGKQQGPYPEPQFRDFLARGVVRADTLVWSEGMAGWQTAGDVPGLMSGASGPPVIPMSGGAVMSVGRGGGALSIDFGIWDFTWRSLLFVLGFLVVIPAPWVIPWYVNWFVSRIHVPGRPNLFFDGQPLTIAPWYFGAIVLTIVVGLAGVQWLDNLMSIAQFVLYWLFLRYLVANLATNGQPLGLSFSGSFWAYLGWTLLGVISILTIIGWAWVYAAQIRWFCRNIQGTRHQVVFKGTGLDYLWRLIVVAIASSFIIPIPWVFRWMMRWQLSQTELAAHSPSTAA
jgi:GYF domain 2